MSSAMEKFDTDFAPSSIWSRVPMASPDPVLQAAIAFMKDESASKVDLTVGAYRDGQGNPVVMDCVKKACKIITEKKMDNEYPQLRGNTKFVDAALELAYGCAFFNENQHRLVGIQTISGTGALSLGFEFISKFLPIGTEVYVPSPTWPNHNAIVQRVGFKDRFYRYYNPATKRLDVRGMLGDMKVAANGSVFILHACGHNPTGCDLSIEEWKDVRDIALKKNHLCFVDMAYQGFANGDLIKDGESVKILAEGGVNLMLAQSFAKSMGLYGQRVGTLSVLTRNSQEQEQVTSQLCIISRTVISFSPVHGARIAELILTIPELFSLWQEEIKDMVNRVSSMRVALVEGLRIEGSSHDWSHIVNQKGMFAFTGLKPEHCDRLMEEYHIYLARSGRISIAGLNQENIKRVAKAFHEVTKYSQI